MKARRVARELALLSLSQIGKNPEPFQVTNLEDLILNSVRMLSEYSIKNLKNTLPDLLKVREYLDEVELNDTENLETPLDADIQPIALPNTAEIKEHIDTLLESAESILHAIELAEVSALVNKEVVLKYAINLIDQFFKNQEEVDQIISDHSEGWNLERLLKLDKNILRLAVTEMKYIDDVPPEVSIDEAVELVKKYSSEESPKFINGILGQVYKDLKE